MIHIGSEDKMNKEKAHAELWYPMRVTYSRELKVKQHLDELGITNFIPLHYEVVEKKGERERKLVPAIHNLIFVHAEKDFLIDLKNTDPLIEPLRFVVRKSVLDKDAESLIITVSDKDMENFMRVAAVKDESVIFLTDCEGLKGKGVKVKVIKGPFAGVTGKVVRIHGNKHVVVMLEDLAAVAVTYIPMENLIKIITSI